MISSEGASIVTKQKQRLSLHFFSRLDIASILMVIVFALLVVGSLFPQEPESLISDPALQQAWDRAVHARYGQFAGIYQFLGIFHFAASPIFLVASGLLVMVTLICNLLRWRTIWRESLNTDVECTKAQLDSLPLNKAIDLPVETDYSISLIQVLRRRRYHVRVKEVEGTLHLRANRYRFTHLGSLANHLAVPLLLIAVIVTAVFATSTNLAIGPGEQVAVGSGTGWTVRNDGFEVLYNTNGSPSSFEAVVTPYLKSIRQPSRLLRVNEPLNFGQYTLFLSSYWGTPEQYGIVLIAARDPGFLPFLAAGVLMLLGMSTALLFPNKKIYAHRGLENKLTIAGKASRYAYAFEEEFDKIVDEVVVSPIATIPGEDKPLL
jgi:cytochrome c biogenesis protein ResB